MKARIAGIFLILAALILAGCSSPVSRIGNYHFQEVYFLTTREDTGDEQPEERFGKDRGQAQFGVVMMAIDEDKTFTSFARPGPNHTLEQTEPMGWNSVQQIALLEESAFIDSMGRYFPREDGQQEILIYIHGYNKSFSRVHQIAAQLRYELAFPGPVIVFAWPSANAMPGYLSDLENLQWSLPAFRDLTRLLTREFPRARIHIIAHSMGNKALVDMLLNPQLDIANASPWPLGELVFIAPDIDRDLFQRDIAVQLQAIPSSRTLYVSGKDFPLVASATFYQYPRLGDSRNGPPIIEGFETIDVSDAIPMFDGHGYYESNRETLEDLYHLIREGLPANERPTLREAESESGTYWRLLPEE